MQYTYSFPRPAVTTDILVFRKGDVMSEILLIKRKFNPYANHWALPGGFVEENETLERCASRELEEETGLQGLSLSQLKAYSTPDRDPRGWTISVVFHTILQQKTSNRLHAKDDAAEVAWFGINELPTLAFDHALIIEEALQALL